MFKKTIAAMAIGLSITSAMAQISILALFQLRLAKTSSLIGSP